MVIDGVVAAASDNNNDDDAAAAAAEEEKRVHNIIVDEWYELVRYLVGLGLCIFGLIGLYFHQFASYYFLKRYTRSRGTERRIGRVVSCEPLVRNTSATARKHKKKKQKNGKKAKIAPVLIIPVGEPWEEYKGDVSSSITDYVREEDTEQRQQQQQQTKHAQSDRGITEYRMFVIYSVPTSRSSDPLLACCHPMDDDLTINLTSSFSVAANCAPDRLDLDRATVAIDTYRSRSLPPPGSDYHGYNNFNGNLNSNRNYININGETEYLQWFQTNTPRPIDAGINLILLKGHPTSACTPELIESHLAQVGTTGKARERNKQKYCHSVSLLGSALVVAVIVLFLACVFEILSMPNPETQRPIGFTVLGGFFAGSVVGAYLFAKLLFEQYKRKVFLSAFAVPPTIAVGDVVSSNVSAKDSFGGDDSDVVDDSTITTTKTRLQPSHEITAADSNCIK